LNQSEPNVILTAHATKVNRPEPNWTEPQTCLAGRNHALNNNSGQVKQREHKNTHYASYTCSVVKSRPNRNLLTSAVLTTMAAVG